MAKSKLPSIQVQYTIPKLELNAMTLAMRLTNSMLSQLQSVVNIQGIHVFSDSEIVLKWLQLKPGREVGQFIHNRLKEIRNICNHMTEQHFIVQFGYVASQDNPADCGTRGLSKDEFATHFWWTGPSFLQLSPSNWPEQDKWSSLKTDDKGDDLPNSTGHQQSKQILTLSKKSSTEDDLDLFKPGQVRTWTKAKRMLAYALRFVIIVAAKLNSRRIKKIVLLNKMHCPLESIHLNGQEVQLSGRLLIKNHRKTNVTEKIIRSLHHLNIRPDTKGILRCHGRLGNAQLEDSAKYPIFILQKSFLAAIVIRDFHEKGHPGINHTVALIRWHFWIPQIRSQVTKLIRKCLQCQKFNNRPYRYPNQGDLPKERVIRSTPFQHVGLDYFGPLAISTTSGTQAKCYGAIITCMTTRMIHLDVVSDLTTTAFLNMLRRFFARRGVPQSITSDNALTFDLGNSILQESIQVAQNDPCHERSREQGN
ncbi:His(2)-Cys(2) zinc finger [Ancylostoma duodenale]|uniref:His(2)-Cys(2) zinc finger n=1 Tax=Ancylostoma duodenale TaxID=51022 RepID=A0A0C2G6Y5_9BILA|nr:His(2)-Cys(2) zinc finger [Ancylostoma duodenale]